MNWPFSDIVERLPERLEEIYAFIGAELSDDVRAALDVEELRKDEHRSRASTKDPAAYGLSPQRVYAEAPRYTAFAMEQLPGLIGSP